MRGSGLDRLLLALLSAIFLALGAAFLLAPLELAATVDLAAAGPSAAAEVRATYGGFELGFGLFLAAGALRPALARPALLAATLALGGFASGRALGISLDGPTRTSLTLLAVEAGSALLTAWRLLRPGQAEPAGPA